MFRRLRQIVVATPPDDVAATDAQERDEAIPDGWSDVASGPSEPGLAALPVLGITRRRMAVIVAAMLAAWILIVFVRQVSEASAASAEAEALAVGNAERQAQVASLERELELISRSRYVGQQARGYGLGGSREIPFALAPGAPALPEDAPGSAALRVGTVRAPVSPLESWLTVLFGPED